MSNTTALHAETVPPPTDPMADLRSLLDQAYDANCRAHYDEAMFAADRAYDMAHALQNDAGIAESRILKGNALLFRGDYIAALECGQTALEYAAIASDQPRLTMRARNMMGIVYRQLGELPTALEHYLKHLELAEMLDDETFQARALNGIAGVYNALNDPETAIRYGHRVLDIYRRLGDLYGEAILLTNMSILYDALGAREQALHSALESWQLHVQIGIGTRPSNEVQTLHQIAAAYAALGQFDQAESPLDQALLLALTHELPTSHAIALALLGDMCEKRGRIDEAIFAYEKTIDIIQAHHLSRTHHDFYQRLSALYKIRGDFENALAMYEQFHQHKDAIFNEESAKRVKLLEARFHTEAARRDADYYRQQARQIEEQRQRERIAFERINEVRDDLFAAIRHDLKNPLAAIRMAVYLLKRGQDGAQRDKWLDNIDVQVARIQRLMQDVLDLVQLESGAKMPMLAQPIAPILQTALDDMTTFARTHGVTLVMLAVPEIHIVGNKERLIQAVGNLLSNAIKFSPVGAVVELGAAWQVDSDTDDGAVRVYVRDHGIGIPHEDQARIFQRFYRVEREDHLAVEGSGLGLALVKAIADQHQAAIEVESRVGVGSVFSLVLPVR